MNKFTFATLCVGWINLNLIRSVALLDDDNDWRGKWFPFDPLAAMTNEQPCDDGKTSIAVDFDPTDNRHSYHYQCLDFKKESYEPKMTTHPLLKEYHVPPAYRSPTKCLNESILYLNGEIPTFGPHRVLQPKYGKYVYLPPQRWLHNLEKGAVVMLYHPCAFDEQVTRLEMIVKRCLYRHIITPSQNLLPDRPLALLAWGRILSMSVPNDRVVVDFINGNAKKGPKSFTEETLDDRRYEAGLLQEAHLVTDETDSGICEYMSM